MTSFSARGPTSPLYLARDQRIDMSWQDKIHLHRTCSYVHKASWEPAVPLCFTSSSLRRGRSACMSNRRNTPQGHGWLASCNHKRAKSGEEKRGKNERPSMLQKKKHMPTPRLPRRARLTRLARLARLAPLWLTNHFTAHHASHVPHPASRITHHAYPAACSNRGRKRGGGSTGHRALAPDPATQQKKQRGSNKERLLRLCLDKQTKTQYVAVPSSKEEPALCYDRRSPSGYIVE